MIGRAMKCKHCREKFVSTVRAGQHAIRKHGAKNDDRLWSDNFEYVDEPKEIKPMGRWF